MVHPIYRVVSFVIMAPYTLRVTFDDATSQVIDFSPILEGELYGPLRDVALFNQVQLDPEVQTLVWPNGADFDPATLHDWPEHLESFKALAHQWARTATSGPSGSRSQVEPRAARAKINPKPWEWEQSYAIGCCDPVGAHREGHIPPDQRLASRSVGHSTCPPSQGRTKLAGTRQPAA